MAAKVPTIDSGTERLGITVAGTLRRKRKITSTTSATASISSNSTSSTDARMVLVRSVNTDTSIDLGSPPSICGNSAVMESTTSMTLAPGWRRTLIRIAGVLLAQLDNLLFSELCTIDATSRRCTAAPLVPL